MNYLLLYGLKMMICSAVFLGYYALALRNRQFHHWNRFYLLVSVILSLTVPLLQIDLRGSVEREASSSIQLLRVVASTNQHLEEITLSHGRVSVTSVIPALMYAAVAALMIIAFLIGLKKIYLLSKRYSFFRIDSIRVYNTDASGTPYSFFSRIFWNRNIDLTSDSGQQIFQHELVHVQEKHSADKLFMQLVLIAFWFNPFFWLIRKELHLIHEFIADKRSLGQSGADALAAMLLQSAYPQHYSSLVNPFFKTSIKRRLTMISQIKNPRVNYFSRLAVLPIVAITILSFSLRHEKRAVRFNSEDPIVVVIDPGHGKTSSGSFSGARVKSTYEDEIVLQLANTIKRLNSNPQIKILLSRPSDQIVNLQDRVVFAEKNNADIFISLHVNAQGNNLSDSSGIEVAVSNKNGSHQRQSELLGSALANELNPVYHTRAELRKHVNGVFVLDKNVCPAVLVEVGYLTNKKDFDFISSNSNQNKIATAILAGIEKYAVNKGKTLNSVTGMATMIKGEQGGPIEFSATNLTMDFKKTKTDTLPLVIVNGDHVDISALEGRMKITADHVIVYQPHSKEAVEKYGTAAEYGVMEFKNAELKWAGSEIEIVDTIPVGEPVSKKPNTSRR